MSERREILIDKYFMEEDKNTYEFNPPLLVSITIGYCGVGYLVEESTTKANAIHNIFNVALEKMIKRYLDLKMDKHNG